MAAFPLAAAVAMQDALVKRLTVDPASAVPRTKGVAEIPGDTRALTAGATGARVSTVIDTGALPIVSAGVVGSISPAVTVWAVGQCVVGVVEKGVSRTNRRGALRTPSTYRLTLVAVSRPVTPARVGEALLVMLSVEEAPVSLAGVMATDGPDAKGCSASGAGPGNTSVPGNGPYSKMVFSLTASGLRPSHWPRLSLATALSASLMLSTGLTAPRPVKVAVQVVDVGVS